MYYGYNFDKKYFKFNNNNFIWAIKNCKGFIYLFLNMLKEELLIFYAVGI